MTSDLPPRNRRSRFTAVLALGLLLTGASVAMPTRAVGSASPKELKFWLAWTDTPVIHAFNGLIDDYNRTHSSVHWTVVPAVAQDKLVASITAANPPDAASLITTVDIGSLASNGAVVDLQPFIARSHLNLTNYTSASLSSVAVYGHQYGMPFMEDTYMLYYNKALLTRAHIARPPRTLSEVEADAKKMTITGSNGSYTQVGFIPTFFRGIWGLAYGGRYVDASAHHITALNPRVVASVHWLADYWKTFNPDKLDRFNTGAGGYATGLDPFVAGKLGMEVAGEYLQPTLQQYGPKIDYGVAPIPYADGYPAAANLGSVGGNPLVIPRGSRHPQDAWNLIQWLETTGTELTVRKYYVADMQAVPELKSIVFNPSLAPTPTMAAFWHYSAGQNILPWPSTPVSQEYNDAMSAAVEKIIHGQESVQAGLTGVQQQIAPQLAQALQNSRLNH